jgi:excisionase family DNA binding protein
LTYGIILSLMMDSTDEVAGASTLPDAMPDVLTMEEMAALLRVDRKTAYAAVMRGEVPGVRRIGRCIRISRSAVMAWLAEGDQPSRRRRRVAA